MLYKIHSHSQKHTHKNMSKPISSPTKSLNHSLHMIFSIKLPPSSSLAYMKHKTLLRTVVFSHIYRLARALTRAKSFLVRQLKDIESIRFSRSPLKKFISKSSSYKQKPKKKKLFFGSFRLHYNWCSSHVTPVMQLDNMSSCQISTYGSIIRDDDGELSGYLQWLEEKGNHEMDSCRINEIDKLADLFIADCHEKFRLEKQESYRRFQEMMARSI